MPEEKPDIISATIGHFGKWQLKQAILLALLKLPIAWFQLSIVFLAPPTQFWCGHVTQSASLPVHRERLNTGHCEYLNATNQIAPCPHGYEYNKTTFRSSIVMEWDLVCGRQHLIDVAQISLMLGVLIGNVLFGVLADRKGRKPVLCFCICFQAVFALVTVFSPSYWTFIIARFLLAVFNGGTVVTSFVMCMEIVGGKWRTIVPILYQIPFGFGNTIMALLAYYLRNWRWFQLGLALLSAIFLGYYWLVPESPRWLLATGRREAALTVLKRAAQSNGLPVKNLSSDLSELCPQASDNSLLRNRKLRLRTILLCLNWLVDSFFAFSQYLGQVGRNQFVTVASGGLIALPGTIACVFIVAHCGRKGTIAAAHLLTAACFVAILLLPVGRYSNDWPRIAFAGLGIVGMSVSMPALYLFTGELFPTVARNAGVGTSVMCCRIGSMVAPLVVALQEVAPEVPLGILAILAIVQAMLVLPLPETKGKKLPETLQDLCEDVGTSHGILQDSLHSLFCLFDHVLKFKKRT